MKKTGKIFSLVMALLIVVLSLSVMALAADSYTITIKGDNSTADHTYEAYQIFAGDLHDPSPAKEEAIQDKVLSNIVWGSGVTQELAVNGKTLTETFDGKTAAQVAEDLKGIADARAFAKKIAPFLSSHTDSTGKNDAGNYVITGLAAGYYLVKDQDNSLTGENDFYTAYMMKVVGNVQATPKGEKPALKKQIKNNNTGMWSETGNAAFQLGDTVSFRMVVTVPDTSRYTDGYIYKIYDTMTEGLTSNVKTVEDFSIEIKNDPNNKLDSKYCSLVTSKIMVDGKEVDHFELSIDIKQAIADGVIEAGNDLCVNYTAVLNDKADFYIIGEGKNTNTAYLEYSNNPNGEGTGKTPESSVHAWTFAMIVSKIDGTTKAPLTGAKFVLSRRADLKVSDMQCDENGNPTVKTDLLPMYTGDSARAPYELVTAEKVAADNNITYTAELGDGIVFAGFGEFTYYLYETKAPGGYNLLSEPVAVTFHCSDTMDARLDPAYITINDSANQITSMHFEIENKSGATLPETGGIGTTLFYVIGGLLVVGAGVLLVTKKRMGKAEN